MKKIKLPGVVFSLGLAALMSSCGIGAQQASADVEVNVNWEQFLERHDLVWNQAPKAWHDGPFLGNGMLGSILHQLDNHTFRISLGRADVEDHKTEGPPFIAQSRLPNGYFTLKTVGEITGFEGRLDLYNAEMRVQIRTDKGTIDLIGLVHSDDMVITYDLKPSAGESVTLDFVPLKAIAPARLQADLEVAEKGEKAHSSRKSWASAPYKYNPDPELTTLDGYSVSRQQLVVGGETGTAWIIKDGANGAKRLLCSIEHSFPETTATKEAVAHLKKVEGEPPESFVQRHRVWWHNYYPKSFLSLDDTRMESFYWIQVYKFGAGARKGRAFMDTMGPWMVENTAWANGWFNLNTQLSYWFLSTANRMEVAESLFTKLDEKLPTLVANMPEEYGDDCAGFSSIVPQTFISKYPASKRLGFTGELLWTCHDYWLMLERTMDAERTQENFFPLLKKSVNTYLHFMVEGDDGKVHLPKTRSPEYGGGEDCNFNLALFRWGLSTLIKIDERYRINDPLLPKWKDVHARLVEYPTNENGYMVAKDFPFEKSHRHYSHLMMIYPLCEINIDQPENRELIAKSVDHWINYPGNGNAGYSWSGAAAMYALQGDGEQAASYLDIFMRMQELYPKNPAKIWGTTMYTETGRIQPVTETPLSLCDSMQLMLLQSWGEIIRIFPAVPDAWKNLCFDGMLAAGGFKVSAVRKEGKTQFVTVESLAGSPCLIQTDIPDPKIMINGKPAQKKQVRKRDNGEYDIALKKGDRVTLTPADRISSGLSVAPVPASEADCNQFGMISPEIEKGL